MQLANIRRENAALIDVELPKVMTLAKIEALVKGNYINATQHLDTSDAERLAAIDKEMVDKSSQLTALYKEVEPDPANAAEVEIFAKIKPVRAKYRDEREKVLAASRTGDKTLARELIARDLYPVFIAYTQALQKAVDFHHALGMQAADAAKAEVRQARTAMQVGVIASVLLAGALGLLIARSVRRALANVTQSLTQSSSAVSEASGQVNHSSQTLARGATEQAASLEETSASLEEISSMTKRNAEAAGRANGLARQTRSAAETGASDMQAMTNAMDQIKASSDNIAKIIKTIDEIAFQTNLLALNAAVEAARAGEAGAGFAVVADEVRALAQRSAQAAKDTAEKIADSIQKSENGVALSGKVATSLKDIVEKAREVDNLIGEIAGASQEQSQGVAQVVQAVAQIDTVTQSNAAAAEESAAAAEELNAQTLAMEKIVSTLQALAGLRDQAAAALRSSSRTANQASSEEPAELVHH